MNLFSAFSRFAPNSVFWSILLGMLAGVAYSLVIPLILVVYTPEPLGLEPVISKPKTFLGFEVAHFQMAGVFLAICLFILIMRTLSEVMLMRTSLDVTRKLRIDIYQRITKAPIYCLEKFGSAKLIAMITNDVGQIIFGARALPNILINLVTVLGMLGFLMILNVDVFWFVIGAIVIGVVTYQLPMYVGNLFFFKARESLDALHEGIRGLIYGAKELKLDVHKRIDYMESTLLTQERNLINAEKTAQTVITTGANYGDLLSFFVIGCVAFIFVNYHSISNADLVGVTMALLYITGPISIIVNAVPSIIMAKVSLNKVNDFMDKLPAEPEGTTPLSRDWQFLELKDVCYQYEADSKNAFDVGPLNLKVRRGEVTFIIGGNGSGKSTMSKLMTLHYRQTSGQILFDDECITDDTLSAARQQISAIYSDYYLFDSLLGNRKFQQSEINAMLKELGLIHKVQYENNAFTSLSLSDGQRRRLALLVSYLDDKVLYLFDEWAADQDPKFKQYFYHHILPRLRSENKAVVVISHDDRYFHLADQIIEMESGKIVQKCNHQKRVNIDTKAEQIESQGLNIDSKLTGEIQA